MFRSGGAAAGTHTQLALGVEDIAAAVQALKSRGLTFEDYDTPNLRTVGSIADLGYARAAWFKDSEGNLLGIAQVTGGGQAEQLTRSLDTWGMVEASANSDPRPESPEK